MTVLVKEKCRVSKKRIILKKKMLMHFHSELSVLTNHVLNALSYSIFGDITCRLWIAFNDAASDVARRFQEKYYNYIFFLMNNTWKPDWPRIIANPRWLTSVPLLFFLSSWNHEHYFGRVCSFITLSSVSAPTKFWVNIISRGGSKPAHRIISDVDYRWIMLGYIRLTDQGKNL